MNTFLKTSGKRKIKYLPYGFDPDRSDDPVRSGATPTPVQSADLSGCVVETRCIASLLSGSKKAVPPLTGSVDHCQR
ncbi:MAG: hypothetical protein LBL04_14860 [Bacteroidales bacterium]|nr:hypothetical protein [Bacteroidales bacterium]